MLLKNVVSVQNITHNYTEILGRMKKEKEIFNTTKRRKMSYFGHILRNAKYELLRFVEQMKEGRKETEDVARHG